MDIQEKDISCEVIGIAGNIGAGKSVLSRILRCNGFTVYDCDREASILMEENMELVALLREILGEECYHSDGNLNKAFVSSMIFSDDDLRESVNSAVHKAVRDDFLRLASRHEGKIFVESAIMATSGLDRICDQIWIVDASEATRLDRVMKRNKISEGEVRARMETQKGELAMLPPEKVVVFENDTHSLLLGRVLRLALCNAESVAYEIPLREEGSPRSAANDIN